MPPNQKEIQMETIQTHAKVALKIRNQILDEIFYRHADPNPRLPDRRILNTDFELRNLDNDLSLFTFSITRPIEETELEQLLRMSYGERSFNLHIGQDDVPVKSEKVFMALTQKAGPLRITTALNLKTAPLTPLGRIESPIVLAASAWHEGVSQGEFLANIGKKVDVIDPAIPEEFLLNMHLVTTDTVYAANRRLGFSPQGHAFIHFG